MRRKSKIFKNFLATASLLGLSLTTPTTEIYAAAVSQMFGDVNLEDPKTNFNSAFVDGNTIEVVEGGIISVPVRSFVVGGILANQNVSNINLCSINPGGV